MKTFVLAALLLVAPALAANNTTTYVVREFSHNASAGDWVLEGGWSWSDGVLTHAAGTGDARQAAMPPLTEGRTYRVELNLTNTTRGGVTVSLGDNYSQWC